MESKGSGDKGIRPPLQYILSVITNDYEITNNVLGLGINGKVVQCKCKADGKLYALKVLKDCPKARREVELHYKVSDCPQIVSIKSVYENKFGSHKCLLIVMEIMSGGELFARIQKQGTKAFTEREAAGIMFEICKAVEYLHLNGIAHRDLKPENLLYTSEDNGKLKLTDFGFAKDVSDAKKPLKTPCYTPYYAPPEILGPESYDKSCDIWSLGVITYILLCGYPPFYSQHGLNISPGMKKRIRSGQYTYPPNEWSKVSDDAKNLITSMLNVDPDKRPSISDIMKSKWIRSHHDVPETPLNTGQILREDRFAWPDIANEININLATMRVNQEDRIDLKTIASSGNTMLEKRKAKKHITLESIPSEPV